MYLSDIYYQRCYMLDFILLGMVASGDLTGYEIKKNIESSIGVFYKASYGSLYPALKRLAEKGLLTMYEKPQGGRERKYYRITDEGKRVFSDWLEAPMNVLDGTNTHLAKVYFFDRLPEDVRNRQLLAYELNNTHYLRKLQELEKGFADRENKDCYYYKLTTLYYGICITRETIRWCQHIRAGKPLQDLM
jgi:DNA-binding PadR family transcriptional regulator